MITNLYRDLLLSSSPSCAFFFGDTSSNKTIDSVAGNIANWNASFPASVTAPGGVSDNDPIGAGYIDTTNGATATISPCNGGLFGSSGIDSGVELVVKILQYPTVTGGDVYEVLVSFGSDSSNFMQIIYVNSTDNPSAIAVSGYGKGLSYKNNVDYLGKFLHIFVKRNKSGNVSLYVNGAMVDSEPFTCAPIITSNAINTQTFKNTLYKGQYYLSALSFFSRDVTDAEIADRASCVARAYKLAGVATLDTSEPASQVLIRRASNRLHVAALAPDVNGAWSCYVPPGDYEITAIGPSGYRPLCDSPVTAVAS